MRSVGAVLVALVVATAGCGDTCQQLAERICNCELTEAQRRTCRDERIESQSNDPLGRGVTTTAEQQEACAAALETCTCDALDQNQTELCGFTRTVDEGDG